MGDPRGTQGASLPCCLLTLKHVRTCAALSWFTPYLHTMTTCQYTSSTSLVYKSELEVGLYHVLMPFVHPHPPPPRMPKRARGGLWCFDSGRTSSISLAYKSERRWTFIAFHCHSRILHLPRMQKRAGGGLLWRVDTVHLPYMQN